MKPFPIRPMHLLQAALVLNAINSKFGGPTICGDSREEIGPVTFVLGWAALTSWFVPHYCKPFFNKEI